MFGGEAFWRYLDEENPMQLEKYQDRLQTLGNSFDATYPPIRRPIVNKALFRRMLASIMLYLALRDSIYLYALNMDGASIVDAYSVVERVASRVVLRSLSADTPSKLVDRLTEHIRLPDLAEILKEQEVWDDSDVAIARRLSKLRDGIAHRNEKKISNLLFSGKKISPPDIPRVATRADTRSIILESLRLILKATEPISGPRIRQFMRDESLKKSAKRR